ncbi:MAG TPA: twin-arginine translocase TatA/TatE family subunit [Candidatus Binataceae bacterium]|nr:twin-arginine translocase TatA/TatE family subunit [Candidatus Binataceae bacterium]
MGIFEIIILLAVALIVVGPERLPEVLKVVGKVLRELRAASNTVLREITEAVDEPRRTLKDLDPFRPEDKPGDPPRQP